MVVNGENSTRLSVHRGELGLCARDFWYFAQFCMTEDEDSGEVRPFPCGYGYLRRLKAEMDANQKTILLKPRRMMASWLMVLDMLWSAKFAGTGLEGTLDAMRGGLMSIGQVEALYLVERISKVHKRLPTWLRDFNPIARDNTMLIEFQKGGVIQAFPLKREGPQTFGFTKVGFDEMALQEAVRGVWTGLIPTLGAKGKLLAVSTPNGKQNLFAEIWFNEKGQYNDIFRSTMDWWEHPEHDDKWFRRATAGMNKQMIARMFEKSFVVYAGQPVWAEFDAKMHVVEETEVYKDRPMFIGWDLGYHYPAVTFWQRNARDQWVGHAELQGYDTAFDVFCQQAVLVANSLYDREVTPEIHAMPHDAMQRYRTTGRITGAVNDYGTVKALFKLRGKADPQIRIGPHEVGKRTNEAPRMKETRKTFALRADGEPGMFVNKNMRMFIEGCQGGYCYPETAISEEPDESPYTHIQDTYQMVVTVYNKMMKVGGIDALTQKERRDLNKSGILLPWNRHQQYSRKYRA